MIRVELRRKAGGGTVTGFRVTGHAGYGPRGQDIVCAAVAALAQTTLFALEELLGIKVKARVAPGDLECLLPDGARSDSRARLLIDAMALGMERIAVDYPGTIKIDELGCD